MSRRSKHKTFGNVGVMQKAWWTFRQADRTCVTGCSSASPLDGDRDIFDTASLEAPHEQQRIPSSMDTANSNVRGNCGDQ